jgi:hypothetical protein
MFKRKIKSPSFELKKKIVDVMVDKIIIYPYWEKEDKRIAEICYSFNKKDSVIKKL